MIDFSGVYELKNIEINVFIIKIFFIILCTYFINFKLINKKININFITVTTIIVIAIVCGLIKYQINYFISIMCVVLMTAFLFSKTSENNIGNSIIVTTISLSINNVIFMVSATIIFILKMAIDITANDYIDLMAILICYAILLRLLFKVRRLKNGFSFLQRNAKNENIDILILNVCTVVLFSNIILSNYIKTISRGVFLGFVVSILLMFITIQKSLQLYYKQKLLIQELNETKEELENTKKELKQVEEENLEFSKKSHTLVHRQKSLEHKIQELVTKAEISTEEAGEVKNRLKEIEKDLYRETATVELSKTEISEIDDMLKYMQSECIKNKIEFELQLAGNIHYMTNNLISKEDLEILLADHIKDAIIAINHTDNINRSILVRLGEIDGVYSLYIYDSGIEFEIETLKNLGKKPSTTHADEGGTGMGFMNTFDTLRKYKASLTINELSKPNKDNYTKVLIFKFDKKNEFKIISYRQEELN